MAYALLNGGGRIRRAQCSVFNVVLCSLFPVHMLGRRRHRRFFLALPWSGSLHVNQEVPVERREDDQIWLLSATPIRRDEIVDLDLSDQYGTERLKLRVAESQPVLVDEGVRHRLRLTVLSRKTITRVVQARLIRRSHEEADGSSGQ